MNKYVWIVLISILVLATAIFSYLNFRSKPAVNNSAQKPSATANQSAIITPYIPDDNFILPETYEVPILMYHYIRVADANDKLGYALSVTPENFDSQILWLKTNNFMSIHLADLADPQKIALRKVFAQNKKPVVITFDDGYTDAYTQALPILKKHQMTGTFFIIRDKVGRDDNFYMNQSQIDEMALVNMEIGSHTLTHPNLATSSAEKARIEISDSKFAANVFCYPSGRYNESIANLVKDTGYLAAVTTEFGVAKETSNLFTLKRVRIENGDGDYLGERIQKAKEMSKND